MNYIAGHYQMGLALARALRLEGKTDQEKFKGKAYQSKTRAGGVVAVSCTKAQNVSKPRGAKPGTVSIRKETVIKVRPGLPEDNNIE